MFAYCEIAADIGCFFAPFACLAAHGVCWAEYGGCLAVCVAPVIGECCPTPCGVPNPFDPGSNCCDHGEHCVSPGDPNSRQGCCPVPKACVAGDAALARSIAVVMSVVQKEVVAAAALVVRQTATVAVTRAVKQTFPVAVTRAVACCRRLAASHNHRRTVALPAPIRAVSQTVVE